MPKVTRTARRFQIRPRLTEQEHEALMHLCTTSGLPATEVIRRLILSNAKRRLEAAVAPDVQRLAAQMEETARRVEAIHSRLGGIEKAVLGSLEGARDAVLGALAAGSQSPALVEAIQQSHQDLAAAVTQMVKVATLSAIRLQAMMDVEGRPQVKDYFSKLAAQAKERGLIG